MAQKIIPFQFLHGNDSDWDEDPTIRKIKEILADMEANTIPVEEAKPFTISHASQVNIITHATFNIETLTLTVAQPAALPRDSH